MGCPTPCYPCPQGKQAAGVTSLHLAMVGCPHGEDISPGGRGGHALQGGRASQLHPKDKDTELVARPLPA